MLMIKVTMVSNLATVPYLENCHIQNLRVLRHAQVRGEPREISHLVSSLCLLLVLDFAKVDRQILMQSIYHGRYEGTHSHRLPRSAR